VFGKCYGGAKVKIPQLTHSGSNAKFGPSHLFELWTTFTLILVLNTYAILKIRTLATTTLFFDNLNPMLLYHTLAY
jgi:hypothetical protein